MTRKPFANSSTAHKRLTGRALQKRNARIRVRDLFTCRLCSRVTTEGEVDHVIPLCRGGSDTDESNLAWTCIPCHDKKSASERGVKVQRTGCDAQGWPQDAGHPWNTDE